MNGMQAIQHGKVYKVYTRHRQHLTPIMKYVRRGLADAKETITLQPEARDCRGARRYNSQECVVARCFNRVYKPDAIAVGRNFAYAVFDGLAIRFFVNQRTRKAVEMFDEKGLIKRSPVILSAVPKSQLVQVNRKRGGTTRPRGTPKRRKRIGVRAIGGGKTVRVKQ
jgi:hypothetical protein